MGLRFSIYMAMCMALFFGWRLSPKSWGVISTLPMQYVADFRPIAGRLGDPEGPIALQYVDDGAFVAPWIGLRPWLDVSLWEVALNKALGLNAVHMAKKEAEGNCATKVAICGSIFGR